MATVVNGAAIPNMPWQERPAGCSGPVWRYSKNPIIRRDPVPDGARAFNSAVVPFGDRFVGVFRIDHHNTMPALHFGRSRDALTWQIEHEVIRFVDLQGRPSPRSKYYYDPRVVRIEGVYYITWCNEFEGAPTIGVAQTEDFETFVQLENAFLPFNRNGVLFPRKIDNEFVMLSRPSDNGHTPFGDIYLSRSPDMCFWGKHRLLMRAGASGWWEGTKIGAGPIPIETDQGWLMIYHGVTNTCNGFVYSMGTVLLDLEVPEKVLARSNKYFLTPEEPYETTGFVPNVAFPCATLCDADTGRLAIYYGAADTYTAVAFATVDGLVTWTRENSNI